MTIAKTEEEIRERITKITQSYLHVLDCWPATVQVNAPRALMQLTAKTSLDELYWMLGETRPRFKCDDRTKMDH